MTEKTDEESVLGSLPATRPTRFGRERGSRGGDTATATNTPAKTTAKPKARAKPKATAKPRAAAKPKTGAKRRAVAADRPAAPSPAHGPRPVRAGAPSLAGSAKTRPSEPPESTTSPPRGAELVTTAIQAAGELAQIGLAVGGQVLRRAVDKLPKP